MKNFFRCGKCYLPNTKPDLHFDKEGICGACHYQDYYDNLDWNVRKNDFDRLINKNFSRNSKQNNNYDCIVAVSGGKDSTYQTHLVKEAGLKPLLLNFEPSFPTELGKKNLKHLVETYECDLIQIKKSPVYRKLCRIGFDLIGDHEWPNHVGIYCWPISMADKLNIPVTFYGEPRGMIGLGRHDSSIKKGAEVIDRSIVEQFVGMNGLRISDIIDYDPSITLKDVIPYTYPRNLKTEIKAYNLGHYFKWDFDKNVEIIKKKGWESLGSPVEGTWVDFEDLDCGFMSMHQYYKFIKYGFGRATDHAGYALRQKKITKKQAKELIIAHDGKRPKKYFKEFLEFLKIDEEYFIKNRNKFTNHFLFKKDDNKNEFLCDHNQNLILEDIWYKSFDEK
jgi:hypothetical protein